LPVTLEEIGVTTKEEIKVIAEKSCVEGESIHNMVADVTPAQLYDAIVTADSLGRAVLQKN
ncbi:MAG: glycerol dehydrogenase, partial [Blautia sp.]|nr:glycerol dehydrogenase [Blautia sp.]